jgi:hypothetical protein
VFAVLALWHLEPRKTWEQEQVAAEVPVHASALTPYAPETRRPARATSSPASSTALTSRAIIAPVGMNLPYSTPFRKKPRRVASIH